MARLGNQSPLTKTLIEGGVYGFVGLEKLDGIERLGPIRLGRKLLIDLCEIKI